MRFASWLAAAILVAVPAWSATVSGHVKDTGGKPIAYAFVSLLGEDYAFLGYALTDNTGAFSIDSPTPGARLAVQPPGERSPAGYDVFKFEPRVYLLEGSATAEVRLPPAGAIVLEGYGADGNLLRWGDYEKRGMFGGQFMYWTDADDRMMPAACWPVHDDASKAKDSPRAMGVPAIFAKPGSVGVPQMLYWEVPGYGKLLMRAHNGNRGHVTPNQGGATKINLNLAFAQDAVYDLNRRFGQTHGDAIQPIVNDFTKAKTLPSDAQQAKAADAVTAAALRLRDDLEFEKAREAIKAMPQENRDAFTVGVFQGGAFDSRAFQTARDAGFDLATILPGWAWCDLEGGRTPGQVNSAMGVPQLTQMGFKVKVHGAVWLQSLGVLPKRAETMSPTELAAANLKQLAGLQTAFGDSVTLWEAFNEPANVNTVGMPRPDMFDLLRDSAAMLKEAGKTTLINSGHEADFGNKYIAYTLDGQPAGAFRRSYLDFLGEAQQNKSLDNIDVIGLQFYPGAQLNEQLGAVQGPCMTPGWLVDTLDRYAKFGKPVHITECSVPSTYESHWTSGYWREKWTPELQADYAERILLIAMAHPAVESFTWWDIRDGDTSVVSGGLVSATGEAKPVLNRLSGAIAALREGNP